MTREERIAAGWVEWFTLKCFVPDRGGMGEGLARWIHATNGWTGDKRTRFMAEKRRAVLVSAAWDKLTNEATVRIVRVWRRKKPKAPPPLAVGDAVWVGGKVEKVDSANPCPMVLVRVHGELFWVPASITRVKP